MAADKQDEKKFTEYLDRIMAGEEIGADEEISDELKSAIEFARTLYAEQASPTPEFRDRLWNRLLNRIRSRQAVVPASEPQRFIDRLMRGLSPQSPAWKIAVGVAAVVLVIIVGAVWYNLGNNAAPMTSMLPETASEDRSVGLPSNVVPGQVAFYLNTSLSSQTEQVPVYKVEQLDITGDYVKTLGNKLGFTGEPVSGDGGVKLVMTDDAGNLSRRLTVWTMSGAIEYGYTNPEILYPVYTPELPPSDVAKKLAYGFLQQLDLLPNDYKSFTGIQDEVTIEAGGGYNVADKDTGSVVQKDPSFWRVNFPFSINGSRATGPGAKIEVSIGDKGEPVNLVWAWKQTTPAYTGKVKSEENAFTDMVNSKGSLDIPVSCENVMVNGVTLSYWINPLSEEQDYVLPVYEFTGDCLDKDGRYLESFTAWTEAFLPEY